MGEPLERKGMSLRFSTITVVALLCAACSDNTGVDEEATFISEPIEFTAGMQEEAVIGSFIGSVQVDGIFLMPSPCHELNGTMSRFGGQLTVNITATSSGTGCPAVIQPVDYRLQRFGLSRGLYRVTVYHQVGDGQRRLINEADVNVN